MFNSIRIGICNGIRGKLNTKQYYSDLEINPADVYLPSIPVCAVVGGVYGAWDGAKKDPMYAVTGTLLGGINGFGVGVCLPIIIGITTPIYITQKLINKLSTTNPEYK